MQDACRQAAGGRIVRQHEMRLGINLPFIACKQTGERERERKQGGDAVLLL